MGIWDILLKKQNEERGSVEDLRMIPASNRYQQIVYTSYYKNYPVKPFISKDREKNTNWLEQAAMLPKQSIIPIEIMTRFSDGLLPGHIYLLYWINKYGCQKQVPAYFEYKYGLNFIEEKKYLAENGYLLGSVLTNKGMDAISTHNDVIEKHSLESTSREKAEEKFLNSNTVSVEQGITTYSFDVGEIHNVDGRSLVLIGTNNKKIVSQSFETINKLLVVIRKELKIKETMQVPVERIAYNRNFTGKLYTYLEYAPLTPTGKNAKYPITVHFAVKEHNQAISDFDCFGSIGYLADNSIGKAVLNIWFEKLGYHVEMGLIEHQLSIKKVDRMKDGSKTTIYYKK